MVITGFLFGYCWFNKSKLKISFRNRFSKGDDGKKSIALTMTSTENLKP